MAASLRPLFVKGFITLPPPVREKERTEKKGYIVESVTEIPHLLYRELCTESLTHSPWNPPEQTPSNHLVHLFLLYNESDSFQLITYWKFNYFPPFPLFLFEFTTCFNHMVKPELTTWLSPVNSEIEFQWKLLTQISFSELIVSHYIKSKFSKLGINKKRFFVQLYLYCVLFWLIWCFDNISIKI